MRERSSRVCRESMPSFLKKSSSGDSAPGASLKCCSARVRTSRVVFSRVGMAISNLARSKLQRKLCSRKATIQTMESRTKLPDFGMYFVGKRTRDRSISYVKTARISFTAHFPSANFHQQIGVPGFMAGRAWGPCFLRTFLGRPGRRGGGEGLEKRGDSGGASL